MAGVSSCPIDISTICCCCYLLARGKSDWSCIQGGRCRHATHSRCSALGVTKIYGAGRFSVFSVSKLPFNLLISAPGWHTGWHGPCAMWGGYSSKRPLSRGQMPKSLYLISHFLSGFLPAVSFSCILYPVWCCSCLRNNLNYVFKHEMCN